MTHSKDGGQSCPKYGQRRGSGDNYYPLRDQVRDELRARIADGRLAPEQRLVEQTLAEEFGVSRVPVREALRSLESEGLVTVVPRRGAIVSGLSRQDIERLYEVRFALEVFAFQLAAERASEGAIGILRKVLAEARAAVGSGDHQETVRLNSMFHDLVLTMADNPFLVNALEPLMGRLRWVIGHGYEYGRDINEHGALVEAIAPHDSKRAAALARSHIQASRDHGLRNYDLHQLEREDGLQE